MEEQTSLLKDNGIVDSTLSDKYASSREFGKQIGYSKTFVLSKLHFISHTPRFRNKSRLKVTYKKIITMYTRHKPHSQIGKSLDI